VIVTVHARKEPSKWIQERIELKNLECEARLANLRVLALDRQHAAVKLQMSSLMEHNTLPLL
jgi:hypothetical protein